MKGSIARITAMAIGVPLLLAGCAGAAAQPKPLDRAAQVPLILEEVLRYELQQFAPKEDGAESVLCVAVREGTASADPAPSIMKRLNKQAQPQSECKAPGTLVAGPVEWIRDDEVRVKGGYLRASEGEKRLAYRVVRENGHWECLGPIVAWDPL